MGAPMAGGAGASETAAGIPPPAVLSDAGTVRAVCAPVFRVGDLDIVVLPYQPLPE